MNKGLQKTIGIKDYKWIKDYKGLKNQIDKKDRRQNEYKCNYANDKTGF